MCPEMVLTLALLLRGDAAPNMEQKDGLHLGLSLTCCGSLGEIEED